MEEFNGSPEYLKQKAAFIPAFRCRRAAIKANCAPPQPERGQPDSLAPRIQRAKEVPQVLVHTRPIGAMVGLAEKCTQLVLAQLLVA